VFSLILCGIPIYAESPSYPFKEMNIPGSVCFADFDIGGNGVAYSKNDVSTGNSSYRQGENINVWQLAAGLCIGAHTGHWMKYTVNVSYSGYYQPVIYYASPEADMKMMMELENGSSITFDLPATENYDTPVPLKLDEIYMESGTEILKFTMISEGASLFRVDFEETDVYRYLYVSPDGSDDNDGSEDAPFASLKRAKEEVARINNDMDGDIVIGIKPGYYQFTETEKFETEHSGKNGYDVIIRGTDILNPPVLSGGTEVNGWEKHNEFLWKAPLEAETVRNLYVNDNMSQRARSKNIYQVFSLYDKPGNEYDEDGFMTLSEYFPPALSNPEDVELCWTIDWALQRTPVNDIRYDGKNVIFTMDHPCWYWTRTRVDAHTTPGLGSYFYIENAPELLDEPGEFYYNKKEKMIYYYPFSNENMNEAKTYVGSCELMFSVKGSSIEEHIENITFENLDIRYGAWNEVSSRGLIGAQADKIIDGPNDDTGRGGKIPPAQMTILNANNINIKNCRFTCLGSGAISMRDDVSDCVIDGNSIDEISGTGIIIGSWDHNIERENMKQCHDIDITNNLLYRTSCEFKGGTAISVYYEKNINILHNHILETPYTGVSLGWGWGEPADFGNIRLSYNHIEDSVIPPMFDGAFVYTLGPLKNSEISYNHLTYTESDYSGGIYPDSGSAYLKIHHNVIEKTPYWFYGGVYKTHDLHTYDNYSDTSAYKNHSDLNTIEMPEVITDGNWNDEAKSIMEEAGLEEKYIHLLENIDYPKWRTDFLKTTPDELVSPYLPSDVTPDLIINPVEYENKAGEADDKALMGVYDKYVLFNNVNHQSAWIEYKIPASLEEGYYDIDVYYWTQAGKNGLLRIYENGKLNNIAVLKNTVDKNFATADKTYVATVYHDGENDTVLRLERDSAPIQNLPYSYYYIRQINLTKTDLATYSQEYTERTVFNDVGGDLRDTGHGYFLVDPVSYVEHTVNVKESGYYDMTLFYANEGSVPAVMKVMVNGAWALRKELPFILEANGSGFYTPASLGTIYLHKGDNVLRLINGCTYDENGALAKVNYVAYTGFSLKPSDKTLIAIAGDTGEAKGDARINNTSLRRNAYGSSYSNETRHDPIMGNSTAKMTYEVDVSEGDYDITILYGTGDAADGKATLKVNEKIESTIVLPILKKSWLSRFAPISLGTVHLNEGINKLELGVKDNKYYTFTGLILTPSEKPESEVKFFDDDGSEINKITNQTDVTALAKLPESYIGKKVTIVFALYKGNRLYKVSAKSETELENAEVSLRMTGIEAYAVGYRTKVMFIDDFGNMIPLENAK